MTKGYQKHMERKKKIAGKKIVGIDPAGRKHQAAVLDEQGIQQGKSFMFPVSFEGYEVKLWMELTKILGNYSSENLVFAIETSCALWKTLTDYLTSKGYAVLLVNPLTTYHSRPLMNHDFSKTDPKDALIVATNAQGGNYTAYRLLSSDANRLHRLSITYEKVAKDRQKAVARLRALMEEVFPEYLSCIGVDTKGSLHLLERYFLPEHFQGLKVHEEEKNLWRISNGNHHTPTLLKLQSLANNTIGANVKGEEEILRLALDTWIMQIRQADESLKKIGGAMIDLAKKTEYFEILTSLKGISDLSASRFVAECRNLSLYTHYKQIEKHAGANLRLKDSGTYEGTRRISKIGNKRLLRLLYLMTTEAVKYIPEIRTKFITRQLKRRCYRKNVIACAPLLLKLIMALIKEKRPYVFKNEAAQNLKKLEVRYTDMRNRDKKAA